MAQESNKTEKHKCHICHDNIRNINSINTIHNPCKCKNLYLHKHCLEKWLSYAYFRGCSVCKTPYEYNTEVTYSFDWETFMYTWSHLSMFIVTLILPFIGDFIFPRSDTIYPCFLIEKATLDIFTIYTDYPITKQSVILFILCPILGVFNHALISIHVYNNFWDESLMHLYINAYIRSHCFGYVSALLLTKISDLPPNNYLGYPSFYTFSLGFIFYCMFKASIKVYPVVRPLIKQSFLFFFPIVIKTKNLGIKSH
jgi:hypothetical protein